MPAETEPTTEAPGAAAAEAAAEVAAAGAAAGAAAAEAAAEVAAESAAEASLEAARAEVGGGGAMEAEKSSADRGFECWAQGGEGSVPPPPELSLFRDVAGQIATSRSLPSEVLRQVLPTRQAPARRAPSPQPFRGRFRTRADRERERERLG